MFIFLLHLYCVEFVLQFFYVKLKYCFFFKFFSDHLPEAPVDYQVPTVKAGPTANVTLHSDRLTKFEEKTTPSLGGSNSSETSTKPAIVFRKRKINDDHRKHARRREDE